MFARTWWTLPLLPVLIAGCGLQDYQKRMAFEQERMQHLDKENELLGAPVSFATRAEVAPQTDVRPPKDKSGSDMKRKKKRDEPVPTPRIFLRLPKGMQRVGHEVQPGSYLFRFPASKRADQPGLQEVLIGGGPGDPLALRATLKEVLRIYDLSQLMPSTEEDKLSRDRIPIHYMTYTARDDRGPLGLRYTAYVHQTRNYQVIIVLRQAREPHGEGGSGANSATAIDYSLSTLALGSAASAARALYHDR